VNNKIECFWIRNTDRTLPVLCRASKGVALIPLTSIESHGPHLPLGSDTLCIEYILKKVAAREVVAILPSLQYSYVADARMLPGAVHVRSDLLADLVENICDEVGRNGFTKIALLQSHGGNVTLDAGFMRRMLEREKPYMVYSIPVFAGKGQSVLDLMETKECGHACEMEASMNLAACPELVDFKVLKGRHFPTFPLPDAGSAQTPVWWVGAHPEMAVGYPQRGTVAKGEKSTDLWAEGIAETVRKIKRDRRGPKIWSDYNRRVKTVHRAAGKIG